MEKDDGNADQRGLEGRVGTTVSWLHPWSPGQHLCFASAPSIEFPVMSPQYSLPPQGLATDSQPRRLP